MLTLTENVGGRARTPVWHRPFNFCGLLSSHESQPLSSLSFIFKLIGPKTYACILDRLYQNENKKRGMYQCIYVCFACFFGLGLFKLHRLTLFVYTQKPITVSHLFWPIIVYRSIQILFKSTMLHFFYSLIHYLLKT